MNRVDVHVPGAAARRPRTRAHSRAAGQLPATQETKRPAMKRLRRSPLLLLSLALAVLAGCLDRELPTALAPEGAAFDQVPPECVVSNLDDSGPGSLRHLIRHTDCSEITFGVTGTIELTSGRVTTLRSVAITGPGADLLTVRGNYPHGVFGIYFDPGEDGQVSISGLTITGGKEYLCWGGGIWQFGGTLILSNSTVTDNESGTHFDNFFCEGGRGGGISNQRGTLTLVNTSVSDNRNIWYVDGSTARTVGGGIYHETGTLTLINSTVTENVSYGSGSGGGIYVGHSATATLINSTVSGNRAPSASRWGGYGGGIENSGTLTLINSTVSGNRASYEGGGIFSHHDIDVNAPPATTTLINSTVADNEAQNGGGIRVATPSHSMLHLHGSIVARNRPIFGQGSALDIGGPVTSGDYNLIGNTTGIEGALPGTNNLVNVDPRLGPLANNGGPENALATWTHALLAGSPAIDAIPQGVNGCGVSGEGGVTEDQRGVSRPWPTGGACDIGAYELKTFTLSIATSGSGSVSASPQRASYAPNEEVTLTATPAPGWSFSGWSGDLSGSSNPATLLMDWNKSVTATFTQDAAPVGPILTVSVVGQGTVTSSPAGIECTAGAGACSASFPRNTRVTLTATPSTGWVLSGWGGDASGNQSSVQVRMNADKQVTASFAQPNGPVLSVSANGTIHKQTGAATISGTLSCSSGTVEITVALSQSQRVRGVTTTVSGSGSTSASCGSAWQVTITPSSPAGSKFAGGAATATATAPGATEVTQTVQLK